MIMNYVKPTPSEWILIIVYLLVFIVGICGNFLVCFAVWKNHSMRTVTNYFIGQLKLFKLFAVKKLPFSGTIGTLSFRLQNVACAQWVLKVNSGQAVARPST